MSSFSKNFKWKIQISLLNHPWFEVWTCHKVHSHLEQFWSSNLKFKFSLAMTLFDLLITETSWIFQVFTGNIEEYKPHYWPNYMGSKRTLLGKAYGIKWGVFGNINRERIRNLVNLLRTDWELDVNTVGTWWEHIENQKYSKKPTAPTLLKRKKNWIY